jgi:rfaE bifunctional protein kinase chain/domain
MKKAKHSAVDKHKTRQSLEVKHELERFEPFYGASSERGVGKGSLKQNHIVSFINFSKFDGKKVVFVYGNFNILHPGHFKLLRFAKSRGDILIVGIMPDNASGVSEDLDDRVNNLNAIEFVDQVIQVTSPILDLIDALKPNFVVKGKEHESTDSKEEKNIIEKNGGKLIYSSGVFGDTQFARSLNNPNDAENWQLSAKHYVKRHAITSEKLRNVVLRMAELKVGVLGDIIVDEYINCTPIGMSQEDSTIVVKPDEKTRFLGGASIVAAHAAGLGAETQLFSVVGADPIGKFILENLDNYNLASHVFVDKTRRSTLKQKFRGGGRSLFKVNSFDDHDIATSISDVLFSKITKSIDQLDLLVLSDFNYGCVPIRLISPLVEYCNSKGITVVADSQSSSQLGDICRFKNVNIITPTEHEARIGLQDTKSGIALIAEKLIEHTSAENVIITLGPEGILIRPQISHGELSYDNLPSFNHSPVDVSGAGDCLLISASMARCVGATIWESALIGSIAAGIQIAKLGNRPITIEEVLSKI